MFNYCVITAILLASVRWDIREGRIPNSITLSGAGLALAMGWWTGGWVGVIQIMWGLFIGIAPFFLLFCLKIMGAGDAKLMGAVGALVGYPSAIWAVISTLIAGGIIGLIGMFQQGRLIPGFKNIVLLIIGLSPGQSRHGSYAPPGYRFPYSLAIAIGALTALAIRDHWF